MTPQEKLKIFSAYLPYNLKIYDSVTKKELDLFDFITDENQDTLGCFNGKFDQAIKDNYLKPVLTPLSEIQQFANEYSMEFGGGVTYENRINFAKEQLENIQYSAYIALSYSDIEFCLKRHINIFNLPESEYVKKE